MQLYLVRHGQSTNNVIYAKTGSYEGRVPDPELTDLGLRQAKAVGKLLSKNAPATAEERFLDWGNVMGFSLTHIYTSLMVRAVSTAQEIADATCITPQAMCELHENGGVIEYSRADKSWKGLPGNNRSFFENRFPNLLLPDDWHKGGWYEAPFEEPHLRSERAASVIAQIVDKHIDTDDAVLCVTHAGFHDHLIKIILRLRHDGTLLFPMNNCAITRIDWNQGQPCLVYLNRICHLSLDEVT